MKVYLQYFLCFLLSVNISLVDAETKSIKSNLKIRSLKNIPSNDVNCIYQDSKGFMWIGSLDGLYRYDGYSFKTYRIDNGKNAISSNLIIAIDEDSFGNIWIGTYGKGICVLDPVTDRFTNYSNSNNDSELTKDVTTLLVDDKNYIWIGNVFGITRIKVDPNTKKIEDRLFVPFGNIMSNSNDIVKKIHQDKNHNIWVGTNSNVYRIINPYGALQKTEFQKFNVSGQEICDYKDGVLIAGPSIFTISSKDRFKTYHYELICQTRSTKILYFNNTIWIGKRTGIDCLIENKNHKWEKHAELSNNLNGESLSSNIITWLTQDNLGQIWVGTRGGGINIISAKPSPFRHYQHTHNKGSLANNLTRCIFEDSHENLWIGTEESGVSMIRKNGNYQKDFIQISTNNSAEENRVYAIEEIPTPESKEHKSLIWLGTSYPGNLEFIDPVSLKKKNPSTSIDTLGFIFSLEAQNDTTIWAGTYNNGLWRLITNRKGDIIHYQNFNTRSHSKIASVIVRSLLKDRKGNIWIGTDKGMNRITASETLKENPEIESFTIGNDSKHLVHDYILQITESKNGDIWIGTMGKGLMKYTEDSLTGEYHFSSISTKDGLPNNTIKSILEDNDGFLWLSSNKGLSKYDPIKGSIVNYDESDGLQSNEFSEICATKRKNGELLFGGIKGFNAFLPKKLETDKIKPKLFFTNFYILNKKIENGDSINGKQILNKVLEYTDTIRLEYAHNSFSIGFVGVHFNAPQKNKYRYKLEGFDQQWYPASPDYRMAKYTNVPYGEYTFKVMAANSDNIWNKDPIKLQIIIAPPLHLSKYAFLVYFIVLVILIYAVYRFVSFNLMRKREVLMAHLEKKKIEEISRAKLQFFTNISHEFRTPLSLITTPLEQLQSNNENMSNEKRNYHLQVIKHNTGLMMRLINQLLDFRKLDQNKLVLKPSKQNVNDFLEDIYMAFEMLAKQKNITYLFVPSNSNTEIWVDTEKMEKVIYNLLSNAFKFTGENGRIVLKVEPKDSENQYRISVSDSGIGIDPAESDHIFERYYQTSSKKKLNYGGTGIGLALSKGIIDLHQGEIGFTPNHDGGTCFYVNIKMGKSHFPEDIITTENQSIKQIIPALNNQGTHPTEDTVKKANVSQFPLLLIVEDNFDLRHQIKEIFSNEYRVIQAEDGLIGSKLCKEHQPDIIISDVMMPNMDGIEMCKILKSDENTSHIPVILLTAKNTIDTQIEGFEIGADLYIPKPFNIDVLRASIKSMLNNREQLRLRFQKDITINPEIISNTPADTKFLKKILDLIEKNLSDSEYSIEQLATDYGVSRIYLNRKIKALTGETSNQFMRNIRLKHAAELLKQNKLNVSEVTWKVGYNDLRTFRKRFKEKFQMSPSEYAKQYKE